MASALFIEGIDGCGKSTEARLLKDYLEKQGHKVAMMREPGGSEYYEGLRETMLAHTARPVISDALLSAAGRAANIVETKNYIKNDTWVLSDRAYPTTFAYQAAQGLNWDIIEQINDFALGGFEYDIKILLDLPIDVAHKRLIDAGKKPDYWQSRGLDFFAKTRENYLKLAEQEGHFIIDGAQSIDAVHQQIIKIIAG